MLTLVVKNFGVLKDVEIQLNRINLFIGENGSGKSVLAKLITIVTSIDIYSKSFLYEFGKLDIDFISNETIIKLFDVDDTKHILFTIKNKKMIFGDKVLNTIDINSKLNEPCTFFTSQYIPSERNLISLLNKSIYSLITSNIPLPKHLLDFASQYEKARNAIQELKLLDMEFKSINGQDRIYYDKSNFLSLENSSSGMQSALPLYLTLKYLNSKHNDIIVEEPEQNLYPKSQVETIKNIVENSPNNLYLMTHSPYVLSTLNILLFAYKAANTNVTLKEKISQIIPGSQQINPDEFSAYFIENGKAIDIKSKRGLISENAIDDSSETIDDEFDKLMDIYREYKNV
ncbi:MAG: AAA family ATPase [Campylobacterota bacterium]|nr:AAA family ATPase [Campylobacterota bacterium]